MAFNPEKQPVATTTAMTEAPTDLPPVEADPQPPPRNIRNAIYTIVCGAALPSIPILAITTALLYVIFKNRVIPRPGWPELYTNAAQEGHQNITSWITKIKQQGGDPAYYVAYNPSTITTISAWTGRVIPYLSSSIMALVAFFAARHIVHKSKHGNGDDLPTPEQLTILINLLNGSGFGPLKDAVMYKYGRRKQLIAPVPAAFTALAVITLLGYVLQAGRLCRIQRLLRAPCPAPIPTISLPTTLIFSRSCKNDADAFASLLIPIVDTWFGVSVHPVVITQLSNNTKIHSYGRTLSKEYCSQGAKYSQTTTEGEYSWIGCNMEFGESFLPLMVNPDETSRVLAGTSQTNMVLNITSNSSGTVYFLADTRTGQTLDFKAKTLAVSTQCTPMTKECLYRPDDSYIYGLNFSCTPHFNANFSMQSVGDYGAESPGTGPESYTGIGFSPDPQFSRMVGAPPYYQYVLPRNPLYFAAWAYSYPTLPPTSLTESQEVLTYYYQYYAAWILNCSATVYDMTYIWADGAVHNYTLAPADVAMGGMISSPFSYSIGSSKIAEITVANAASLASTPEQLSETYANGFSAAALAMAAGVMSPSLNLFEQHRNSTVGVARVPLIPLYLLLSLKALYVLTVVVLAVAAYCFTHPAETDIVKAQLSVKGLVTAHFNQPALIRSTIVQEIQGRLDEAQAHQREVESSPPVPAETEAPKVGMMANAEGTWQFVTLINGVWKSVQPLVQSVVLPEARTGRLGEAGDIYAAWK